MSYFAYILFSEKLDEYYIGHCQDTIMRLQQHNEEFYKNAYTSQTNDWKFVFQLPCESRTQAILMEKHIKKMKSRKYIENFINYPEMADKLKKKFK